MFRIHSKIIQHMNKQENLNSDGKTVNASAGMTQILELTDTLRQILFFLMLQKVRTN